MYFVAVVICIRFTDIVSGYDVSRAQLTGELIHFNFAKCKNPFFARKVYIYITRMRWASRMAGDKHSFTIVRTSCVNMADLAIGETARCHITLRAESQHKIGQAC